MVVVGYILLSLGFLVGVVGEVMFLRIAYRRSLWCFFGCFFVPLVGLVFLLMNLKSTAKPFGLSLLGCAVACYGGRLAGIDC